MLKATLRRHAPFVRYPGKVCASSAEKRRHVFKQTATNINRVRKKSAKKIHTVLLRTLRRETCELQIFIAVTVWRCDRSQESSSSCLDHFSFEKFIQRRKDHTRQQLYAKDAKIEENISSLLRELPSEHPLSTVSKRCAPPGAKENLKNSENWIAMESSRFFFLARSVFAAGVT